MFFELTIPGKPVPKGRPRGTTAGCSGYVRFYTPQATREYELKVAECARLAMAKDHWPIADKAVACELIFFVKRPKNCPKSRVFPSVKPDLDNYVKAVVDGMSGIVFEDDKLIVDTHSAKRYAHDEPKTLVRIWMAGGRPNESDRRRDLPGALIVGTKKTRGERPIGRN